MRLKRAGFTLTEMAVVTFILSVLVSVAVPTFVTQARRGRENSLRTGLQQLRSAIGSFHNDTGLYPTSLKSLISSTQPGNGLTGAGATAPMVTGDWRGPYLDAFPVDPVSNAAWNYVSTGAATGTVKSSSTGNDINGTPYTSY